MATPLKTLSLASRFSQRPETAPRRCNSTPTRSASRSVGEPTGCGDGLRDVGEASGPLHEVTGNRSARPIRAITRRMSSGGSWSSMSRMRLAHRTQTAIAELRRTSRRSRRLPAVSVWRRRPARRLPQLGNGLQVELAADPDQRAAVIVGEQLERHAGRACLVQLSHWIAASLTMP